MKKTIILTLLAIAPAFAADKKNDPPHPAPDPVKAKFEDAAPKPPTLSEADKLAIRELQLKAERAQRTFQDAQLAVAQANAALLAYVRQKTPEGWELQEDQGQLLFRPAKKEEPKK